MIACQSRKSDICRIGNVQFFLENKAMQQTLRGILSPDGTLTILENIHFPTPTPVLITVLQEEADITAMSEQVLAKDWLNETEEEAWLHLQQA